MCKHDFKAQVLRRQLAPHERLKKKVTGMALRQLKREGLVNDKRLTQKGGKYYNDVARFALDRMEYYLCWKCKKPYLGNARECEAEGRSKFNATQLLCGG